VSLPLINVDTLGYVTIDGVYQIAFEGTHSEGLSPGSSWEDGLSDLVWFCVGGFSEVVLQEASM
jgi:hypothetical protein